MVYRARNGYPELVNHLGNVMVVVSDKRIPSCSNDTVNYYTADVLQATDYSAFGVMLKGRELYASSDVKYRNGFNGKERDNEVAGSGTVYDYGFRIYNSSLGRFLSVDPLTMSYPWYTPYQFAGNKVIMAIDLDGLEDKDVNPNTAPTDPNLKTIELLVAKYDKDLKEIWNKSFLTADREDVEEWGFKVVENEYLVKGKDGKPTGESKKIQQRSKYYTSSSPNSINGKDSYLFIADNERILLDVHTHPYPKSSTVTGVAFSGADLFKAKDDKQFLNGSILLVEGGTQRFALAVVDKVKAQQFLSKFGSEEEITKQINVLFKKVKKENNIPQDEAYNLALAQFLKDSGIDFYESYDFANLKFKKVPDGSQNGTAK
jgi:RHS repeat-associated protein